MSRAEYFDSGGELDSFSPLKVEEAAVGVGYLNSLGLGNWSSTSSQVKPHLSNFPYPTRTVEVSLKPCIFVSPRDVAKSKAAAHRKRLPADCRFEGSDMIPPSAITTVK